MSIVPEAYVFKDKISANNMEGGINPESLVGDAQPANYQLKKVIEYETVSNIYVDFILGLFAVINSCTELEHKDKLTAIQFVCSVIDK